MWYFFKVLKETLEKLERPRRNLKKTKIFHNIIRKIFGIVQNFENITNNLLENNE